MKLLILCELCILIYLSVYSNLLRFVLNVAEADLPGTFLRDHCCISLCSFYNKYCSILICSLRHSGGYPILIQVFRCVPTVFPEYKFSWFSRIYKYFQFLRILNGIIISFHVLQWNDAAFTHKYRHLINISPEIHFSAALICSSVKEIIPDSLRNPCLCACKSCYRIQLICDWRYHHLCAEIIVVRYFIGFLTLRLQIIHRLYQRQSRSACTTVHGVKIRN